jgi:hypothetical protein
MTWLGILALSVFGIIWVISSIADGISKAARARQTKVALQAERDPEYKERFVLKAQTIFDRNCDIIEKHATNYVTATSRRYGRHRLQDEVRDCINEICIVEKHTDIQPNYTYLSTWRERAPVEWKQLSEQIEQYFAERYRQATLLESRISQTLSRLRTISAERFDPLLWRKVIKRDGAPPIVVDDIPAILTPNAHPWTETETALITYDGTYKTFPSVSSNIENAALQELNKEIAAHTHITNSFPMMWRHMSKTNAFSRSC